MEKENALEKIIGSDVIGLLKCNICWDFFTEPTILPCGHTFCMGCLNEIGRHRVKNAKPAVSCDVTILCPNCRHGVMLDDVNNLKNGVRLNYALSSIKETLTNSQSVPKADAATNTETGAVLDEKLEKVEQNMNNVFYELKKKGNVIHSTYAEIAKIRENHLGSPACNENMMSQEKSKTKWDQDVDVKKSKLNVNQPEFVPRSRQSFGRPQNTYRGRGGLFFGGRPWKFAPAVAPQYNAGHPAYDPAIVSVYGPSH